MERRPAIDYEKDLNPRQLQAVTTIEGPQLVIAGAGTGKTRTLVYRVAYLVERGVSPESVLLLTFTRKAAQEMMRRAATMLDARCALVTGGTFHSFANLVLRRYAPEFDFSSRFTIVDRSDAEDIVNLIRTELGLQGKDRRFPRKSALVNIFSRVVNTGKSYEQVLEEEYPQFSDELEAIAQVAAAYTAYKQRHAVMDYDDLLVHLARLLREKDTVRKRLSNDHRYVMVDEFQDTNPLQAEIAYQLASEHRNIAVVGDDAQSIYSFRGADFRNIMDFPKRFPDCLITTLEQNYRSTQPILSLTNAIIANAREKFTKQLFSQLPGGRKPVYLRPAGTEQQAVRVVQEIRRLRGDGVAAGEIAVLFRAAWHSNELEVMLKRGGIEFIKYGGLKFVESAHIKDLLALLRVLFNPRDGVAWYRILLLIEGIGPTSAKQIIARIVGAGEGFEALTHKTFAKRKYGKDLGALRAALEQVGEPGVTPTTAVTALMDHYRPIMEQKYDDAHKRVNDLASLIQIADNYTSLEALLSDLTLEPPEQALAGRAAASDGADRIVLSTIHSAKGLEWHSVFIIHLVDGYLPSSYAFYKTDSLEEERRLFYVAATRAKENLYLIAPQTASGNSFYNPDIGGPSRFLHEIQDLKTLTKRVN